VFLLVALVHLQMGDVVRMEIIKDAQVINVALIQVGALVQSRTIQVGVLNMCRIRLGMKVDNRSMTVLRKQSPLKT
jgi:hypothetical protein